MVKYYKILLESGAETGRGGWCYLKRKLSVCVCVCASAASVCEGKGCVWMCLSVHNSGTEELPSGKAVHLLTLWWSSLFFVCVCVLGR